MKIIISGGSGLIGRALTSSLSQAGHECVILSRSPNNVRNLPKGARAIYWDARTPKGWASEIESTDAIVNLAGANLKGEGFIPSRWTTSRKQQLVNSRLQAGAAIVAAVESASRKPALLIQSSAVGYYGPHADEQLKESAPPGNDFLARLCLDWEASTRAVEKLGLRHVVVRTGLALTNKGGSFPLLALPFKFFLGNTFGTGRQYYSWIHMADLVSAFRFIIENKESSGVYNLTAPQPLTNREFASTLGRVMRRPSFFPLPAFAMKLALGEVSTVVLDGQRVLPDHLISQGFQFQFPDLESALQGLSKYTS